jgi:multicomponent Na+:H+ antiporter subunit E
MRQCVVRLAVFAAMWWVVSEGDVPCGIVSGTVVAVAAAASLVVLPAGSNPLRWRGVARFVPWFLAQAVAGGVDVARRAWSPRLPIDPGVVEVPLRLESASARIAFAWTVSLMPGTATVALGEDRVTVHALDQRLPVEAKLLELERRLAEAFAAEEA